MRPQTQVLERIVFVSRDDGAAGAGLTILVLPLYQVVDRFQLVWLVSEQLARLVGADNPVPEGVIALDYPSHARLDLRKILRRQRPRQVEVVVEAVCEPVVGRPPRELRLGEPLLDGLRHHMGRGVAYSV